MRFALRQLRKSEEEDRMNPTVAVLSHGFWLILSTQERLNFS
jgi:hypothetical protein